MGAALIGSCMMKPMVALADSSEVNGDLNGYACRGTVSINSRDAYAVTTFARGNANIRAWVTLVAYDGKKKLTHKGYGTATAGGAVAKASINSGAELTQYAEGRHETGYDSFNWSSRTYIHI